MQRKETPRLSRFPIQAQLVRKLMSVRRRSRDQSEEWAVRIFSLTGCGGKSSASRTNRLPDHWTERKRESRLIARKSSCAERSKEKYGRDRVQLWSTAKSWEKCKRIVVHEDGALLRGKVEAGRQPNKASEVKGSAQRSSKAAARHP